VPMNTKDPVTGNYEFRDVIMPGIGLYRIQADRSGTLAGASEPEFGPDINGTFTNKSGQEVKATYPEWCRITMKKLVGEHIVDFVAKEYWIENYATDSNKTDAPNAMWRKRPRGQLAKCAEAQALRKGWPEIGSSATAEEMAGKIIDMGDAEIVTEEIIAEQITEYPADKFTEDFPAWEKLIQEGKRTHEDIIKIVKTVGTLNFDQLEKLKAIVVNVEEIKTVGPEHDGWLDGYDKEGVQG